jgi:hypothetical protein
MKKSTSRNEACYFLAKSNALKLKEELGIAYAETFQKGYSVVEIARYTGTKTCKYIHAHLVKQGMIPKSKTGPLPKGLVPGGMGPYLSNRGLTFSKWVSGRGLDPKNVLRDIEARKNPTLESIRVDFPGFYKKLTGADANLERTTDLPPIETIRKNIIVIWDDVHNCYRCTVEGFDFEGYGNSPAEALSLALWWYRGVETIRRLSLLPDIREERIGW